MREGRCVNDVWVLAATCLEQEAAKLWAEVHRSSPDSQPPPRVTARFKNAFQRWRGRARRAEVSSVGRRSPDLILTLIHSRAHTRALSSTDLFSHLLASDMRVVISTWHTRCVFLCVCLAVCLEDIHKVY